MMCERIALCCEWFNFLINESVKSLMNQVASIFFSRKLCNRHPSISLDSDEAFYSVCIVTRMGAWFFLPSAISISAAGCSTLFHRLQRFFRNCDFIHSLLTFFYLMQGNLCTVLFHMPLRPDCRSWKRASDTLGWINVREAWHESIDWRARMREWKAQLMFIYILLLVSSLLMILFLYSKQFKVVVYSRLKLFFRFVRCYSYTKRCHHMETRTNCYCVIDCIFTDGSRYLFFFRLQIKTRRGRRFDNHSSDGTATTTSTAKHSTAVDGLATDGSRWEEDAPSDCQQQWAPSNAEH